MFFLRVFWQKIKAKGFGKSLKKPFLNFICKIKIEKRIFEHQNNKS
jgi:hypothetical protein